MSKLPRKLIVIKNQDKAWHEKWKSNQDPLDLPHPFRIIVSGKPNSGKTMCIKNIIVRQTAVFEKIIVVHNDYENTQEYTDLDDIEMVGTVPETEEFDGECKTLIVLDDLEFGAMSKTEKKNLDRLFGYVSTHLNCSCILTSQTFVRIPSIVRRCANFFILWRCDDKDQMNLLSRRTNVDVKGLMDKHFDNSYDSLWIDNTDKTPYKIRKNGYELIS